nr:hypothetical protein [Tanacetum cinerariifolium]
ACLNDSSETSSEARLVSKEVTNKEETPSLDNILSLSNRFDGILGVPTSSDELTGVEADISNMETSISASPAPTHRIHKDHPKSQIICPVDTPIQTRHKSKMVEEQSFMATIHQKTDPALLQFCLYSCFLSQVKPKRVSDALQDPSWVEAIQEVKKDASSLRYIALPNWAHDALLAYSPKPSSNARLISKRVANQEETPSMDNILLLTNQFEDVLRVTTNSDESNGVEANISNMETTIIANPTPTLRIHKDHPKSQIIGPLDTLIQTKNKSKEVEEQSFIAIIHQKTDPALL